MNWPRTRGRRGHRTQGSGVVVLMRFKQICNHPSQWLGDGGWAEDDSGKWARLRDIAESSRPGGEGARLHQFREVIAPWPLSRIVFGRPGWFCTVRPGEAAPGNCAPLSGRRSRGFFVLSLKAGGAGLNLTAASHVVHFDRWWNPAVENQAPTAPSASARPKMCWCINSCARYRGRSNRPAH